MSNQQYEIGKIIGSTISDLRKNEGLTQKEFSKIFNLSESSIAHYEQGRTLPDANILLKIADHFGVNIDYLYGRCSCRITYSDLNDRFVADMSLSDLINIVENLPKGKRKFLYDAIQILNNSDNRHK